MNVSHKRAMREWARTDDAATASVRAADQRVLDTSRELAAALTLGMKVPRTAMV